RAAQKCLAEEITTMVHGEEALRQAQKISTALFSGDLKQLSANDVRQGFKDVPTYEVESGEINLLDLLVQASISSSKRQAREDINNGAIYINGERTQDLKYILSSVDKLDDEFTIIRRGKRNYYLIRFK